LRYLRKMITTKLRFTRILRATVSEPTNSFPKRTPTRASIEKSSSSANPKEETFEVVGGFEARPESSGDPTMAS